MMTLNHFRGWVIQWSSSHSYYNPQWDDKKNKEVFGLCANPLGHGHDYKLEVCFLSENADPVRIKATMNRLKEKFDHQNLSHLPEFKNLIPTTENLAYWIFKYLKTETGISKIRLRLWETDLIWVDLSSE
jgi:6-pyruvoyltetrahydropterin/6-carboxytetrahydropterin synthase